MKNVTVEARLTPKIVGSQIARMRGWLSMTPPEFQDEVLKRCRSLTFQSGETLYHLGEDPRERRNLALRRPEVAADLRARIEALQHGPLAPSPGLAMSEAEKASLEKRLTELGYL